jgi:CRP-like cAMP-binding protein
MNQVDMRAFARAACPTMTVPTGTILFREGDQAESIYLVHSGEVEMLVGDKVVDRCGPNDTFGFMSVIDAEPRALTARTTEDCLLSVMDRRGFQFMVDEIPNFAFYIMRQMAGRIRGMSHVV